MNTRSRCAAASLPLLALLLSTPAAHTQESSVASTETARVKLFSFEKGKVQLYVDSVGAAILPKPGTFVSIRVRPGWHLLWGTAKPEWLRFEAGRTHALVYSPAVERWCLDDTIHTEVYAREKKLTEVTPTTADLTELASGFTSEKFNKMRARAGDPVEPRLPADFKAVYRKSTSPAAGLFKVESPKAVHVDANGISIDGGATIPTTGINMLQFYGVEGTNGTGPLPWAAVLYRGPDGVGVALLGVVGNYNEFFSTVALARAGLGAHADTTGAAK